LATFLSTKTLFTSTVESVKFAMRHVITEQVGAGSNSRKHVPSGG